MEVILLVIAVSSLLVAAGLSVVVFIRLRQESDAAASRVESLQKLARAEDAPIPAPAVWDGLLGGGRMMDAAGPMFGAADEPRAPRRRWLALAAVALVMTVLGGAVYAIYAPNVPSATLASPRTPQGQDHASAR